MGPAIAQRIVEGRPYKKVEDLIRVKGIRKKKMEQISRLVKVK